MTTTLVLGGTRSGKSRHAESLLRGHERVTYVATRSLPELGEDEDLAHRIRRHQARRPSGWRTVQSRDLTRCLIGSREPVLVDDIGDWLRGQLTDHRLWDSPDAARERLTTLSEELAVAAQALPYEVVLVTQDAALREWPREPRERLYLDLLGQVNHRLSAASTHVHVVVAGRVLDLSGAPLVAP